MTDTPAGEKGPLPLFLNVSCSLLAYYETCEGFLMSLGEFCQVCGCDSVTAVMVTQTRYTDNWIMGCSWLPRPNVYTFVEWVFNSSNMWLTQSQESLKGQCVKY